MKPPVNPSLACPQCGKPLAMAKLSTERLNAIAGPQPLSLGATYRYCPSEDLVVFVRDGAVIGHEGMNLP